MYDEYHEYRVDTQRWSRWPKALIMTHEWSTDGHDRRIEQRRYVPDNHAVQLEMENSRIKANADRDRIKAENAKLRELLVWAVEVADDYYYCSGVKDDLDAVKNEMRELGIEVES